MSSENSFDKITINRIQESVQDQLYSTYEVVNKFFRLVCMNILKQWSIWLEKIHKSPIRFMQYQRQN